MRDVLVLGAGVIGLGAAREFQRSGKYRVKIWAPETLEDTTSWKAAAFWDTVLAGPQELTDPWSLETYRHFTDIQDEEAAGITFRPINLYYRTETAVPSWAAGVRNFEQLPDGDLPHGYFDGARFITAIVEMPIYLRYLQNQFIDDGGQLEKRSARTLDEAVDQADIVINASGLGARELNDSSIFGIKGQILVLEANRQVCPIDEIHFDPDPERFAYIVPRPRLGQIICGGTAEAFDETTSTDPDAIRAIFERCRELVPDLEKLRRLGSYAGVRPARPEIRFENERLAGGNVIHLSGFGGAGVTLHIGAARAALAALDRLVSD